MSYPAFCRSRQIKTGRLIAPIICFLPALLLLLTMPIAGAQTLPLPTHAAGFYTAGSVQAVAVDASGRFYIGGDFSSVNGVPRSNLARFNADGTLDTAWNPNPDSGVSALAVAGDTVYVGGGFTTIGGQTRNHIAALDATTGAATAWNPNPDSGVSALAVAGDTVYVGGYFTTIGGQARNGLAALDAGTGAATAWNPNPDGPVSDLAVAGDTVYAGGSFTAIGGQARNRLAALDATTGAATAWNPDPYPPNSGGVFALAVSGDTVYAGGNFATIGGQARNGLAALDAATGAATAWNPNPNGYGVGPLAVAGNTVYVGGNFNLIGGQARGGLAALDATTGAATAWNPNPYSGGVSALAVAGDTVYAGGDFATIGGATHLGAAAIATTGEVSTTPYDAQIPGTVSAVVVDDSGRVVVGGHFQQAGSLNRSNLARFNIDGTLDTAWNPNPDGYRVSALAVAGDTVYAGGYFTAIGGQTRNHIAALDATTGAATAWNPNTGAAAGAAVRALAVAGDTVYAGGYFTAIGGQARGGLAALDATTGTATAWNPNPDYGVSALAVSGDTVYVGGWFTAIGGQARNNLAALDASTGAATAWNPNPDFPVEALAVAGNTVYVGGATVYICGRSGCSTGHLKAFDATTGAATTWNPNLIGNAISALAVAGNTVYAGGYFNAIDGQARNHIAALDAGTGAATAWNPSADSTVSALAVAGDTVYAGGDFAQISGVPRAGFVALPADGTPSPTLTTLSSAPNPASFGQPILLTATVTGQNPTGAVAFTADGWIGCRAAALISGSARCVAGLSVGSHAIGAAYGGDANNNPSAATPLTQTVRNAFTGASPSGQGDVGAEFSGGGENCHLTQAALVDPPAAPPPGYSFPHGLLRFTLDGACTGPVTVQVTYPAALPAGATFWKYGRTAAEPAPHWYTLPAALAGASATFALTDGGLGDDDLAVNGSITDDGGVGVPITEIPTLTEWLALLLAALLLGFGGWRLRQNRSL